MAKPEVEERSGGTSQKARSALFVAFEGGDAAGKSTQAQLLAESLGAVLTREPGGTELGEQIRGLVLDPEAAVSVRTESLLMAAARAQHVDEVIRPALEGGRDVVTDRFLGSSVAYQGYGRGLPPDEIRRLSLWATAGLEPDIVILLDVPEALAARRPGGDRDRMESAGDDFHRAVAEGFRAQAKADPERWVVLDGTRSIEQLAEAVSNAVAQRR